jgi:predicted metal-dependent hydrolase
MKHDGTSSTTGAGTPDILSTPISPFVIDLTSSPVEPPSTSLTDPSITEEEGIDLLTPKGLSCREYNLFKRKRKAALKQAKAQAEKENTNLPAGYKQGDFGRQARKLTKSHDKHGMISPNTHRVVKPAVVRHYQYKKCFKVAEAFAKRSEKKKSQMRGGIRML